MLTPSIGFCWTPFTDIGCGSCAASRIVGAMSMTWWNCVRISPLPVIAFGQCTIVPLRVPPQCDATCFVHWYGVFIACAQPTAKWLYDSGPPNLSSRSIMNCGVSIEARPLKFSISLNVPFSVPSADAPLSPMM